MEISDGGLDKGLAERPEVSLVDRLMGVDRESGVPRTIMCGSTALDFMLLARPPRLCEFTGSISTSFQFRFEFLFHSGQKYKFVIIN